MPRIPILIASLVVASALPTVPKPNSAMRALSVRGGFDATTVATAGTVVGTANALMMTSSPEEAGKIYLPNTPLTPLLTWFMENMAAALTCVTIMSWCLLKGVDSTLAAGFGFIPWLLAGCKALLNNYPGKCGVPAAPQYFVNALNVFGAWAMLTQQAFAPDVIKGFAAWIGLNGVAMALAPKPAIDAWGVKSADATTLVFVKAFGYFMCANAAMLAGIALDEPAAKIIGYGWAPCMLSILDGLFVSKNVEKLGMNKDAQYFWLAVQAAVVGGTLLL